MEKLNPKYFGIYLITFLLVVLLIPFLFVIYDYLQSDVTLKFFGLLTFGFLPFLISLGIIYGIGRKKKWAYILGLILSAIFVCVFIVRLFSVFTMHIFIIEPIETRFFYLFEFPYGFISSLMIVIFILLLLKNTREYFKLDSILLKFKKYFIRNRIEKT